MANNTPIVDKAEHFMHGYGVDHTNEDRRSYRQMPAKIGFVYSDVARQLENELNDLKQKLIELETK